MLARSIHSPFGDLTLVEDEGAIISLHWRWSDRQDPSALLDRAVAQLTAYVAGQREVFDLPLRVRGTDFQRDVCAAMSGIPFGYTRTYGEIANDLGVPAQAVGQACGGNPIPITQSMTNKSGVAKWTAGTGRFESRERSRSIRPSRSNADARCGDAVFATTGSRSSRSRR